LAVVLNSFIQFPSNPGLTPAQFIGEAHYAITGTSQTVALPGGTNPGDVAIIFAINPDLTGPTYPAGWSHLSQQSYGSLSYFYSAKYKQVDSTDISGGINLTSLTNGGLVVCAVYRNVLTVATAAINNTGQTGSTVTVSGFNKSTAAVGLVGFFFDDDTGSNPTSPLPNVRLGTFSSSTLSTKVTDLLDVSLYANGSTLTWTGASTPGQSCAYVFELRS
jgi:hypothetical protein